MPCYLITGKGTILSGLVKYQICTLIPKNETWHNIVSSSEYFMLIEFKSVYSYATHALVFALEYINTSKWFCQFTCVFPTMHSIPACVPNMYSQNVQAVYYSILFKIHYMIYDEGCFFYYGSGSDRVDWFVKQDGEDLSCTENPYTLIDSSAWNIKIVSRSILIREGRSASV